jgi:hypothetical protein
MEPGLDLGAANSNGDEPSEVFEAFDFTSPRSNQPNVQPLGEKRKQPEPSSKSSKPMFFIIVFTLLILIQSLIIRYSFYSLFIKKNISFYIIIFGLLLLLCESVVYEGRSNIKEGMRSLSVQRNAGPTPIFPIAYLLLAKLRVFIFHLYPKYYVQSLSLISESELQILSVYGKSAEGKKLININLSCSLAFNPPEIKQLEFSWKSPRET